MRLPLRAGLAALLSALAGAAAAQPGPDAERGKALFAARCALCHAVGNAAGGQGPGLAGIVGRRAGSAAFGYSRGMRGADLTWDAAALDRYLTNPGAMIPGTTMVIRVPIEADRRAIVAYLATLTPAETPATAPRTEERAPATPAAARQLLTGRAALGDWRLDAPGVRRRIISADMPEPYATGSAGNAPRVVDRPPGALPRVPAGFRVDLFAEGFDNPRVMQVAPNGDVFLAETASGRVRVLRAAAGATRAERVEVFAGGLDAPFGIAFAPGPDPAFVYVAETNRVLRFPYRAGDLKASGAPEVVVPRIVETRGGHTTRDLAFAPDGTLLISIGSGSNVSQGAERGPEDRAAFEAVHGLGGAWGTETGRAAVIAVRPDGSGRRMIATGLRNCVGLAVHPATGEPWCSTNERDGLGDDLVPDYVTRVRAGAFYGWPWYYVGDHEDPRHKAARPDLKGRVTVPDVLIQPHSAPLQMTFYDGTAFPSSYRGDAFAALHGSWNRAKRTGYKVVRIRNTNGVPSGEYEDFLTGFVLDDRTVWGRPVGVAVARDGALLVSEDGNGTIWRVAPTP